MRTLPRRSQSGIANPSPLVMLSVVAVAMAGLAFFATKDPQPAERVVTAASTPTPTVSPTVKPTHRAVQPRQPKVDRSTVYVEVYNNSGITGLAGRVGARATDIGWQVVGSDNWYGTIPASTVYYPPRLKAAGRQLALDLGIARTMRAVDPMRRDRLTVVLTADAR